MNEPKRAEQGDLASLRERLKDFDIALFTTVNGEGKIHTRPMQIQEREDDADVWFVTSDKTMKVDELEQNPSVGVYCYRDRDSAYVSVAGTATITRDRALIEQMWKPDWKAWFPEGKDSPDIALIKVTVDEAEYWKPEGGTLRVMFEEARGMITGQQPDINPPTRVTAGATKPTSFTDPA